MSEMRKDSKPAGVTHLESKQAGEIPKGIEPSAWSPRMVKALREGVKGGKWFSLIDKVHKKANLEAAYKAVKRNRGGAGVDNITLARFEQELTANLERISEQLKQGIYSPQAIKRVYIPKPGGREKRGLGIPTVRDRIVQQALRQVIEPIFEVGFAQNSYGFRPKRSCKDALRQVDKLLKKGHYYVLDADIKSYFDMVPHTRLLEIVEEKIADSSVLELIKSYLEQDVMEDLRKWSPERGTPQGAVISPLLSNIYLNPLDKLLEAKGIEMVRYADDFVVLCKTPQEIQKAYELIQEWMQSNELTLHPTKTKIVNMQEPGSGFDFLGYRFERTTRRKKLRRWPSTKSVKALREKIKPLTKRTSGVSLKTIIELINPVLKGWFGYFKHGYANTYRMIDGWVRMRIRCIWRKRHGLKGRGDRRTNIKLPNSYFRELGLFSMSEAVVLFFHSARR